jgi:hypothetical protein
MAAIGEWGIVRAGAFVQLLQFAGTTLAGSILAGSIVFACSACRRTGSARSSGRPGSVFAAW